MKELECWSAPEAVDEAIEAEAEGLPAVKVDLAPQIVAEALARRVDYWGSELAAIDAKFAPILERYRSERSYAEKRQEAAKRMIMSVFPPSPDGELVGEHVRLFYTTSERLQIVNEELIPIEYVKHEPTFDNAAIKADLKAGKEVPGATIHLNYNLQIKPGGLRGKENAKQRKKRAKKIVITEGDEKLSGLPPD